MPTDHIRTQRLRQSSILLAALVATVPCAHGARAGQNDLLVGIDGKTFFDAEGMRYGPGGHDSLAIVDITNPAHPSIRASLPLANTVLGPPTNLQITPNGALGLLASSVVHVQKGDTWAPEPDDKLYVIDLAANPPALAGTVTVGKQPSGLAISPDGKLALVANRAGKSVSVLAIDGKTVRAVGEVAIGDEVAAVLFMPDGHRAFVAKNTTNRVGVLAVDGQTVTYDKSLDIPMGGLGVYNLDGTPNGDYVLAANTGVGAGNADTITVIDAKAQPPRAIYHVSVGDGPEGFAISPDGKWAATPLLMGSSAAHNHWGYHQNGSTVLLDLGKPEQPVVVNAAPSGGVPEGIAWSPDSQYLYVGNYTDNNLQVYRVVDGKLTDTGVKLALGGQPASVRGVAR
ncbi:MAG: YncE family protein [Acetobacteraceae bacterium]|nr:YncE family protein [Acetobacteraceae bacterium]